MRYLAAVDRGLSRIEDALNWVTFPLIMLMVFGTTLDVFLRYVFRSPIQGTVEVEELMMAPVVFFAIAFTEREHGQIGVDIVLRKLKGRSHHAVLLFDHLFGLFVFVLIAIATLQGGIALFEIGDISEGPLYIPTAPFQMCVFIGSVFLCIRFVVNALKEVPGIFGGQG